MPVRVGSSEGLGVVFGMVYLHSGKPLWTARVDDCTWPGWLAFNLPSEMNGGQSARAIFELEEDIIAILAAREALDRNALQHMPHWQFAAELGVQLGAFVFCECVPRFKVFHWAARILGAACNVLLPGFRRASMVRCCKNPATATRVPCDA